MKEHSHISLGWYTLGVIKKAGSKWIIEGLLVRWNEQIEERDMDGETVTEYVYDAHRFDYELPPEVQTGLEAVEYYLEAAQSAVLQLAQDLAAQEAGFVDPD
jgi:hypothetical protein